MAKEKNSSDKSAPNKTAAQKSPAKKAAAQKAAVNKPAAVELAAAMPSSGRPAAHRAQPSTVELYEEIRQRAYELYCERGGHHGSHEADWHRAELEVRSKYR
jgi:Protein of unknown function (DUF2934)